MSGIKQTQLGKLRKKPPQNPQKTTEQQLSNRRKKLTTKPKVVLHFCNTSSKCLQHQCVWKHWFTHKIDKTCSCIDPGISWDLNFIFRVYRGRSIWSRDSEFGQSNCLQVHESHNTVTEKISYYTCPRNYVQAMQFMNTNNTIVVCTATS